MNEPLADDTGFTIETTGSTVIVVAAPGEIDLAVAPMLRRALDTALSAEPETLLIDLSGVAFIDSAALGELTRAATQSQSGPRMAMGIVADTYPVRRPITLVGLDRQIPLYGTRDEALAALT